MDHREGDVIHGFCVTENADLPDYKGRGILFRHLKTGFRVYFVENDDKEQLFSYVVYTPPASSKGISHIIEHTVLAGSSKYPVKDPFMLLVRNSPNTYLNALTGVDRTYYPAASTVRKDIDNIFAVYTDAVFSPLLREETFMQEGIRISKEGKPHFEGVVYSEMFGVMADHESVVSSAVFKPLFGDSPYQWESGGDCREIARLTYEEYLSEWRRFYVPSNIYLFIYGDADIDEKLKVLDGYLSGRDGGSPVARVGLSERWDKPRMHRAVSAAGDGDNGSSILLSWLLGDGVDPVESAILSLAVDILLGAPGCPLYKAIIESGLGSDLSTESGMCSSYRELAFAVGFAGAEEKNAGRIEDFLLDALSSIAREGLDPMLVESAIRKWEFTQKEIKGGVPNGMRLLFSADKALTFGFSPVSQLSPFAVIDEVKMRLKDNPHLFEDWIMKSLIDNPHRLLTVVAKDPMYSAGLEQEIEEILERRLPSYGSDKEVLFNSFQTSEDSDEAKKTVPRLSVSDLPAECDIINHEIVDGVITAPMTTGGIVYTDILFDVSDFSYEELDGLVVLTRLLSMCSAAGMDYSRVITELRYVSGGSVFYLESGADAEGKEKVFFTARLKSLPDLVADGLDIYRKLFLEADLKDVRRIAAALSDILTEFQSNAIPSANSFGISYASQSLSASLYIGERITGITCWEAVRKMSEADPTDVSAALEHVYRKTFARSRMIIHISAEKEDIPNACKAAMALRSSLPEGRMEHSYAHVIPGFPRWTGFSVPSQVSFVSMAGRGASFTSAESPADKMLLSMLSSTVLWQRIREKGGAYGAGIALDPIERCWYFYSYRDPRIDGTIDDMLTALDGFSFDEESLSDALIGELSRLVKPVAPSSKAMLDLRRIVYSIKDEDRKLNLCRTLSLTADDISQAADRFRASLDDFRCTVIGGGKAIGESVHPFIIKSLL